MSQGNHTRSPGDSAPAPSSRGAEEMLERLLPLADPGPQIPSNGAKRIWTSTRPLWQASVRSRAVRTRSLWAGAALATAASVIAAIGLVLGTSDPVSITPIPVASIAAVRGQAVLTSPESTSERVITSSEIGEVLLSGSQISTDTESMIAFVLDGGHSLRVDTSTHLRFESERSVFLSSGGVYVDSQDAPAGIEVQTSIGVARDIGTQFEVRSMPGHVTVRVRGGMVALARDGEELHVSPGTAVTVGEDGSRETSRTEPWGEEWSWTQNIAPRFMIEGVSALEFLDWVSSETGLWVHFSQPDLEELARTTTLHGSIENLSPREAPDFVLPGCGLEASIHSGTLTVRALNPPIAND